MKRGALLSNQLEYISNKIYDLDNSPGAIYFYSHSLGFDMRLSGAGSGDVGLFENYEFFAFWEHDVIRQLDGGLNLP